MRQDSGLRRLQDPSTALGMTSGVAGPILSFRLELAQVVLRGITGKKVSESDIIDAALRAGIDALENGGSYSYLAIILSR
jgi:hypothetical protein